MLGRTYDDQVCSIARTLGVLGDRWTLLIVRDTLLGLHRFEEFQNSLGVARNVLTDRLSRLVDAGVFERVPYQHRPLRYDYQLTATGRELAVPLIGLMQWGDLHLADAAGPPRLTRHRDCGGALHATLTCADCGQSVPAANVEVLPGPGLRTAREHAPPGH